MLISDIGDNLNILICLDYSSVHNWMGFLCWYSIFKNLPNAHVFIACNRKLMSYELFSWAKKSKIPFILHKESENQVEIAIKKFDIKMPILIIPPDVVCIRGFEDREIENKIYKLEEMGILSDCKSNFSAVFVSYLNGWGKFVTSDWIHKDRCPLLSKYNFSENFLNINEARIGKIWKEAALFFNRLTKV